MGRGHKCRGRPGDQRGHRCCQWQGSSSRLLQSSPNMLSSWCSTGFPHSRHSTGWRRVALQPSRQIFCEHRQHISSPASGSKCICSGAHSLPGRKYSSTGHTPHTTGGHPVPAACSSADHTRSSSTAGMAYIHSRKCQQGLGTSCNKPRRCRRPATASCYAVAQSSPLSS